MIWFLLCSLSCSTKIPLKISSTSQIKKKKSIWLGYFPEWPDSLRAGTVTLWTSSGFFFWEEKLVHWNQKHPIMLKISLHSASKVKAGFAKQLINSLHTLRCKFCPTPANTKTLLFIVWHLFYCRAVFQTCYRSSTLHKM